MVDPVVESAAHWMVGIAILIGVCAIAVGIVSWLRSRHPERLRVGERLPPAIDSASDLPNAHEIHREYRGALLKKTAILSIFLGASFILVSLAALALLPPLQSSLAQISAASGEEFNGFDILALPLFVGLAAIVIEVCVRVGSLLAVALLPRQLEQRNNPVSQVSGGRVWRDVTIIGAPIVFLWAITLMYALPSTATWVYPPHVVALKELNSRYPWIPFAIPFALLASTLVSGLCIWRITRLAPRRMTLDISVSARADRLSREDNSRFMTSNLLTASFLPGMMQFMVVAQCYVPAFKTPTGDPWFVFILPLLVWFGWFMFLNVRGWFRTNRRVMAAEGL